MNRPQKFNYLAFSLTDIEIDLLRVLPDTQNLHNFLYDFIMTVCHLEREDIRTALQDLGESKLDESKRLLKRFEEILSLPYKNKG